MTANSEETNAISHELLRLQMNAYILANFTMQEQSVVKNTKKSGESSSGYDNPFK